MYQKQCTYCGKPFESDKRHPNTKCCSLLCRQRLARKNNPERERNRVFQWKQNNRGRKRELNRIWYANNPEKARAAVVRWNKNNPEKYKEIIAFDAHRRRSQIATLTAAEWRATLEVFDRRCAYCDCKPEKFHRDHFVPVSKGGHYVKENIVPACPKCNLSKNDKMPDVWLKDRMTVYYRITEILGTAL